MAKITAAEREEARAHLRKLLPVGSAVYGSVVHVARSGMSRTIRFYVVESGAIREITGYVASALGERCRARPDFGLRVGGCGMDMVFHTVMNLSYALHGGHGSPDAAQVKARNGRLARGVKERAPTAHGPGTRAPGYTLTKRDL